LTLSISNQFLSFSFHDFAETNKGTRIVVEQLLMEWKDIVVFESLKVMC